MTSRKRKTGNRIATLEAARSHGTTWIVAAHQRGATVFEKTDYRRMRTIGEIHLNKEDIRTNSDRPGRAFDSHTQAKGAQKGTPRHSLDDNHSPKELAAEGFAVSLAKFLGAERSRNSFTRLILVAEPRFLGKLTAALDTRTRRLLERTFEWDFAHLSSKEIVNRLKTTTESEWSASV